MRPDIGPTSAAAREAVSLLRLLIVLLLAVAGLVTVDSQPANSAEKKTYTADISPHAVAAGGLEEFTATLNNTATEQRLGSANITPPAGFTLVSTDQPSKGTATIRGNILKLRNLSIPPGHSTTITFGAQVSCDAVDASWTIVAKQANNFSGSGNDFTLDEANSNLAVAITGCAQETALRFATQPTAAETNTTITGSPADPAGTPIQVEVIDANGQRVTSSTATITIELTGGSPEATLAGTTTRNAVDGVAAFDDLRIDLHGAGYTLVASSPDLDAATSVAFNIHDDAVLCEAGVSCTGTVTAADGLMQATVDVTSPTSGALLLSLGVDELDCGDPFNHAPDVLTVDAINLGGTKTVRITIDKAFDQRQPNNGVTFYEVCYSGDAPFVDKDGNTVPAGGSGLLPSCQIAPAPCLASRTKAKAGDVKLVVRLAPGDPRMI